MYRSQSAAPVPDYYGQGFGQGHQLSRSGSLSRSLAQGPLPPRPTEVDGYARHGGDRVHASEAEPMQATAKHPKLKLKITLARGIFEAGDTINGMLELTTSASQRLRLGEIAIELEAFEELTSRDHAAAQIFLYNRTLFQSEHLPPSNAVLPAAPVKGHWTARKGRTTFPFSFKLPATCPSSIDFSGHARLRYTLKGTCQTWWNDTKTLVTVRSDAPVVERWHDELDPRYLEPIEAIADSHLFMGGNGAVWLEAALAEQLFVAGGACRIRAGIKNNTKRNLSGIKVVLARRLKLAVPEGANRPAQRLNLEPQITEVVDTQHFKGPSYEFPQQEEVVVDLTVNVPREMRTIRKTRLFEVSAVAIVCIDMGTFAKDLMIELPLYVAHPSSLQPMDGAAAIEAPVNLPRRAVSSMGQHGQHHAVPVQPYERMTPSPLPNPYFHPQTPGPPAAPAMPMNAVQLPPPRPASAAASMSMPYMPPEAFSFSMQNGQAMWDPSSVDWAGAHAQPPLQPPVRSASVQNSVQHPQTMSQALGPEALPPRAGTVQPLSRHMSIAHAFQPGLRSEPISSPPEVPLPQYVWNQTPSAIQRASQSSGLFPAQKSLSMPPTPHEDMILQMAAQQHVPQSHQHGPHAQPQVSQAQQSMPLPAARPVSQLGAAGLTTITEDSESNAGTLPRNHKLDSVSQKNIDQFERMAEAAENGEDARKAMAAMGMVPDDQELLGVAGEQSDETKEKTWPRGPCSTTKKSSSSSRSKPSVAELFDRKSKADEASDEQDGKQEGPRSKATLPAAEQAQGKNSEAAKTSRNVVQQSTYERAERTPSSQGQGLTSLESRLKPPSSDVSTPSRAEKARAPPATYASAFDEDDEEYDDRFAPPELQRRLSSHMIADSALKAAAQAAAERERRAKEDEEERKRDAEHRKASEQRQKARQAERPVHRMSDASEQQFKASNGERKHIDVNEIRKLNKEAVNRVAGWLTTSPDKTGADFAMSPKTPSASVLVQDVTETKIDDKATKEGTSESQRSSTRGSDDINKSLRGGRGGRVASVAGMWASIAEGTDGSVIKSTAPVVTLRPQAQRSGASGMRALDFSPRNSAPAANATAAPKSILFASPIPVAIPKATKEPRTAAQKAPARTTAPMSPPIVVKNRVRSPSASKSGATHLVNTTMPRPVFSNKENAPDHKEASSSQGTHTPPGALPPGLRKLADKAQRRKSSAASSLDRQSTIDGRLPPSRKITSDLVAAEARQQAAVRASQPAASKLLDQLAPPKDETPKELPMNGRGTTKPIGKAKLASLRDLWGG